MKPMTKTQLNKIVSNLGEVMTITYKGGEQKNVVIIGIDRDWRETFYLDDFGFYENQLELVYIVRYHELCDSIVREKIYDGEKIELLNE